jgi:methionyl-tRNA formyltransferase
MPNTPLRILFAGTPEFAALHLKALIDSEHQLTAVYTQPDRPAGRGKKLQASPVKQLAVQAGLPLCQPTSLKDVEVQKQLQAWQADVLIVVAYGLILPQTILDATRLGCLNVHASLLPRWRGAAPIQRAIEAGDECTGITIMQMDAGLDTGDMLATIDCPIGPRATAASLHDELAQLGPPLLLQVLDDLQHHQRGARKQTDGGATYAHKMVKSEAQMDWRLSAMDLDRQVRAFNPFPVCYSPLNQERVRIWQARPVDKGPSDTAPGTILEATEEGILINCSKHQLLLEVLQIPGGRALTAAQTLHARRPQFAVGECFEPTPESQD